MLVDFMRGSKIHAMEERENKSGVGCFIMGAIACMLLPLYVLSIGPAVWLAERNPSWEFIGVIYAPIGFLASSCEPVDRALTWYLEFWLGS